MAFLGVFVSTSVATLCAAMMSANDKGIHISLVQLRGHKLQRHECFDLESYECPCACPHPFETLGTCDAICHDEDIKSCSDDLSKGDYCVPTGDLQDGSALPVRRHMGKTGYTACVYQYVCDVWPTQAPPTPQPTDTSGGFGDPHMVNILGEHFNIWHLGEVELLKIPRSATGSAVGLRFVANVSEAGQHSDGCVKAPYMTSMRLGGSLLGTRELFIKMVDGEMRVLLGNTSITPGHPYQHMSAGSNVMFVRPSEARFTVKLGGATIDVMHDAFFKHHFYLNMEARNLGSLGFEIGGVLGLDDHTVVAQKPTRCAKEFLAYAPQRHGSYMFASLDGKGVFREWSD